jgi:hypothetical protein
VARRYPAIKLENKSFLENGPVFSITADKKVFMEGFLTDNGFYLNSPCHILLYPATGF